MVKDMLMKIRGKPIIVVSAGSKFPAVHYHRLVEEPGLPIHPTPERAVKVLGALVRYGAVLKQSR